ncbi:MAG: hypothetical protein ACXVH3_32780 [Solirubrobacteraceae bacterium]
MRFSLIVPLAMGYSAIRALAAPIVGAEQSGHLDTILALPISRRVLLVGSYPVAALVALAIMAVVGLLTFIAGRLAGTGISAGLVTAGVIGVAGAVLRRRVRRCLNVGRAKTTAQ